MNAANEVAVAAFLGGQIRFLQIAEVVSASLEAMNDNGDLAPAASDDEAVEWALMTDASARRVSAQVLSRFTCRD
jgi:1-deoxy-D-xylulose-5-phosphate reductoisomerase